jgi:hypothetical protein
MTSKGADIWGTSDQFRFADANWATGNTSITVRVRSVQNVNAWTKAGVMFRQESTSLEHAPNDRYVFVMVTPGKGVTMQYRSAVGANAASVPAATVAGTAPGWLRMTKADDTYTGYWSKDGVAWTRLGSITVSMDAGLTAGLALTSHDVSTAATASFDDLLIQ